MQQASIQRHLGMISCRNLSLKARSLSYSSRAVVPPEFPDLNDILTTPTGSWIPSSCLPTPSPNNLPPNSVLTRPCLEFVLSFLSPPPTPGIRTHFGSAEVLQPPPHSSPALESYPTPAPFPHSSQSDCFVR